jgi:hypothetical protein
VVPLVKIVDPGGKIVITRNSSFPTLSTVANLLVIGGGVLVAAGSIALLYGLVTIGQSMSGMMTLIGGLGAVLCGLLGIAAGELVGVAFAIELNTRYISTVSRPPASN